MRAFTELSEGSQILALAGRHAIEADTKKLMVQLLQRQTRGLPCHLLVDAAFGGEIPGAIAPFLKEVWIALGLFVDFLEGALRDRCALVAHRAAYDFIRFGL